MKVHIMRISIMLGGLALVVALLAERAAAQGPIDPGYGAPPQQGFATALPYGTLDGPVWLRYTLADQGFGYENGYTTLGALIPWWNASGDAHWFTEVQGHVSDEGNFFGNIGVGRRIYEHSLRRSFGWSMWFDYDGDEAINFGHSFQQGGASLDSFGDLVDLHFNAYLPVREEYLFGGPRPGFAGNRIVLLQGIDAALRGADFEAGVRLPFISSLDLRAYIGGYGYGTSTVDPFLGISGRVESHPAEYVTTSVRVTSDERFGTTTMFGFELHLGGRRQRGAYERMAEPVRRNDHITRFHQDPQFAINPKSGLPYNVIHVNNLGSPSGAGTVEFPFLSLLEAQNASVPNDVILLTGGGVRPDYTGGIVLKDNQQLIGSGQTLVIRNGQLLALNSLAAQRFNLFNTRDLIAGVPVGTASGDPLNPNVNFLGSLQASDFVINQAVIDSLRAFINQSPANARLVENAFIPIALDTFIAFPGSRPTITNPGGAAVTLADCNLVAGIQMRSSLVGIDGQGIDTFSIQNNLIDNNSTAGIRLNSVRGVGLIRNNTIVDNNRDNAIDANRPNPPLAANTPFAPGIEITVGGADSLATSIRGNSVLRNDSGLRIVADTTGVVFTDMVDNHFNLNVNDGVQLFGLGTGTFTTISRTNFDPVTGSGGQLLLDPGTGQIPQLAAVGAAGATFLVPSNQMSFNGTIDKIVDTNGNGRGLFADVLDGNFNLVVDRASFFNNDSSFFPRYGALQLNLEPGVDAANVLISNNTIMGTGRHDIFPRPDVDLSPVPPLTTIDDGFVDSGSGLRIVTNPGLGVTHSFDVRDNNISRNFSDGVKLLMLTEGLRTAAIPEGTVRALFLRNTIIANLGIVDDDALIDGFFIFGDTLDDYDSPGNLPPFPIGLASNPDPKNEFHNNINGGGLIVRAKGTDNSRLDLDILNNTIVSNESDAINLAFAGRGGIDYVPSPTPPPPGVTPAVPLTPVLVFDPVLREPINAFPIASIISPDTFGVSATVIIDNNQIGLSNDANFGLAAGSFEDAIKVTLLDGSKVQMRITNNNIVAGDARGTVVTMGVLDASSNLPRPPGNRITPTVVYPGNGIGIPAVNPGIDTAIEIDTWDTSRLALTIDNNDITAPHDPLIVSVNGPHWGDGGITIQSHENSILVTRITRNRINEVLDGNTDFSDLFSLRPFPLSGAGINLLAEGNSTMIAFVNNNDLENRSNVIDPIPPSTGTAPTDTYFEATSADTARLCLQLLDNNAEPGISPQLSHTTALFGDAFYLVQTELSVFELEPTRATNHEDVQPEQLSLTTASLAYAGPGPLLPVSALAQFGNVPSGTCEVRVRQLPMDFPFDVGFPGVFNFDPVVTHP